MGGWWGPAPQIDTTSGWWGSADLTPPPILCYPHGIWDFGLAHVFSARVSAPFLGVFPGIPGDSWGGGGIGARQRAEKDSWGFPLAFPTAGA